MKAKEINDIYKKIDDEIKSLLIKVRDGKETEITSCYTDENDEEVKLYASYSHLSDLMEAVGFKSLDDTDFNGWQNDYWETYEYNDKKYYLSGSMAYSTFELRYIEND